MRWTLSLPARLFTINDDYIQRSCLCQCKRGLNSLDQFVVHGFSIFVRFVCFVASTTVSNVGQAVGAAYRSTGTRISPRITTRRAQNALLMPGIAQAYSPSEPG